jgi:hypothetical protein
MDSLASVFEDGEHEAVEATTETTEVVEGAAVEPETVEKETEPEATTAPEVPEAEPQNVPLQALKAEREKRQAAERQIAEFNANKEKVAAPDVFDDQKAYTEHMQTEFSQAMFNERANMSEFYARREFKDLDDKLETFQNLKATNPALSAQVQNAASPYHEIVDIVAKHEKMEKMQNIDEFEATTRAEIEAKVRAELGAEFKGKADANQNLRDSIPTSLVSASSKGSVNKPAWVGAAPLNNIFND